MSAPLDPDRLDGKELPTMSTSTVGLLVGLLLTVVIVSGGFTGLLLAIVLGAGGFVVGGQLTGELDVRSLVRNHRD